MSLPREDRAAIFLPFAVPDRDLAVTEVHVLDPQAHALHQPQAGAGEEARHQVMCAGERGQHALDLHAREHDGEAHGAFGALDAVNERQVGAEHLAVKKQERRERLILRGGRDSPLVGQVRDVLTDLVGAHLGGVALAVEEDEALDMGDVCLLGADALMEEPDLAAHALK